MASWRRLRAPAQLAWEDRRGGALVLALLVIWIIAIILASGNGSGVVAGFECFGTPVALPTRIIQMMRRLLQLRGGS